jgi:tetratricopeptide (TPR) repeat protein
LSGHPSDDLLSTYALDPSLVDAVTELEDHLDRCEACGRRLEEFSAIEALLAEPESWPGEGPPPQAPRALVEIAARDRREDAEADAMLAPLLDRFLARSSWAFLWADIASMPEYHTAGVVRKLADAADKAQYSVPSRALLLAETANTIVGMLAAKKMYTPMEIAALRGLSWKQQANANRQLGTFQAAFDALDRAERAFRELRRPELDLASVTYLRAVIYTEQQKYDIAAPLAERSTAVFSQLGQIEFYFRSRQLQGWIAFEQRRLGEAQSIFSSVLGYGETNDDLFWIAHGSMALGNCFLERGELSGATQYLHRGMSAFRDVGMLADEIRCRWGLALVFQRDRRYLAAIPRLRDVRDAFTTLGNVSDAGLVTLDIMETYLLLGKPREVRRTAGNIVKLFKEAGMVTGAVTAADYLKQAAAMSNVTSNLIGYIRRYLRQVAAQPDLVFVPPQSL